MQATTREPVQLTTRAAVRPASVNEKRRTVQVMWSTGADVERVDWMTGERYIERLSMDPKHVRLGRLKNGAPVLDSHRSQGTASVIGVVEDVSIRNGEGIATLRFDDGPEGDQVWRKVVSGILRAVSVGYVGLKWRVTRSTKGSPEIRTAVDWEPYEISMVPIGAEAGAGTRAAQLGRNNMPEANEETTTSPEPSAETRVIQAERERVGAIERLCQMGRVDAATRMRWLTSETSVEDAREATLAIIARRQEETHINPVVPGDGIRERSMVRDAADALVRRAGVAVQGDGHRNFGDARLLDLAKRSLESGGVNTGVMSGTQLAERALTTSDFGDIILAAGDRIVRAAYDTVPLAHREVLRRSTANDFREKHSISNASASILEEVPEGGVYPFYNVSAEKASYALKTYGGRIGITRQMIVGDQFSLVESAARQRGRSAAETERAVVFGYILSNPAAPDGNPMFDNANHGNYPDPSATPISAGTLAAARKALRTMLSPDGFPTNGLLRDIIVAPSGEVDFDQLINGIYVPQSAGSAMTPSQRNVRIHVEPLLSSDKKHWLGFAEGIDSYEYSYLSGSEGPRLERRVNFETDTLELKVVLDLGVGAIDWRGVYYQRES